MTDFLLTNTVWQLSYSQSLAMGTMIHFQIDPHSGIPVYRQMMDQVKYYVAAGTLPAGGQLPSIRELAQRLAVNPTTVVRAYTELEHERVIEMRHGKGAFVSEAANGMNAHARDKALRRLARQLAVEAVQMGAPGPQVLHVLEEEMLALQGEAAKQESPIKLTAISAA